MSGHKFVDENLCQCLSVMGTNLQSFLLTYKFSVDLGEQIKIYLANFSNQIFNFRRIFSDRSSRSSTVRIHFFSETTSI